MPQNRKRDAGAYDSSWLMTGSTANMRCRTCGYDLRALAERRCPECGRPFDPSDTATFLTKPINALRWLVLALACIPLLAWPPLLGSYLLQHVSFIFLALGPASMITAVALSWVAAWHCIQIIRSPHPWVKHRWALLPAIVIGGGVVMSFLLGTIGQVIFDLGM